MRGEGTQPATLKTTNKMAPSPQADLALSPSKSIFFFFFVNPSVPGVQKERLKEAERKEIKIVQLSFSCAGPELQK